MNLIKIITNISNEIIKNRDYLTELDRAIGDGDHGVNLARGAQKILASSNEFNNLSYSEILMKVAMILMSNVGGASGAIYSSALMRASQILKEKNNEINLDNLNLTWLEMIQAIQKRGQAKEGEKTLLDVLIPAQKVFEQAIKNKQNIRECFKKASEEAFNALENSKKLIATKGRAAYLGERSKDHLDPGSASSALIIKIIYESL